MIHYRRIQLSVVTLAVSGVLVHGQTPSKPADRLPPILKSAIHKTVEDLAKQGTLKERQNLLISLADVGQNDAAFAAYVIRRAGFKRTLREIENTRIDEQEGSSPGASGTTTVVSKGGVPGLLAAALENGAVTRTVNSTSSTLRANLLGLSRLVTGEEQFPYCPTPATGCDTPWTKFSRNTSFSVTIDTSRPSTKTVTAMTPSTANTSGTSASLPVLTGNARQISNWGFRYALSNPQDLRNPDLQKAWAVKLIDDNLQNAGRDIIKNSKFISGIQGNSRYQTWQSATQEKILNLYAQGNLTNAQLEEGIGAILDEAYSELVPIARSIEPDLDAKMQEMLLSFNRFFAVREQLLEGIANKNIFTLEYTNPRPLNQPDTSVIRAIYAWQPKTAAWSITANLAAEFYNSPPKAAHVGSWRDLQLSAQYDHPLPEVPNLGKPVFSLAGYYQYMQEPALLTIGPGNLAPGTNIVLPQDAAVLLAPKGNIGIAQAKLTVRMKDTGVSIPLAVTWASRTELIQGHEWRGNVGISFDLDSLFLKK
jgi:hypothetical protein